MNTSTVVVVGAGLGGLATAIRLAGMGYDVTVLESRTGPGGKAYTAQFGRYRFDTGPSLLTLKGVFDDLFAAGGARFDDYVTVTPLDRICNYFWRDGTRFSAPGNGESLAAILEAATGEPRERVLRFLAHSRRIYDITARLFLERSLHDRRTYLQRGFWKSLVRLPHIDALRTMNGATEHFFRDPRVRQFFNRYATYNGSDPFRTPGTLHIIPHVEYGIGAWSVEGGVYQIPLAMERVARELGVRFEYGTRADAIVTDRNGGGAVRGVRGDGRFFPAQIVVSNVDVTTNYERLLDDTEAPGYRRYRKQEPSSSGIVFYWGVRRLFPELGLHNVFFSDDYRGEFRRIFHDLTAPEDPTIYINITSKAGSPGDAPRDGENWFVLVNAPADYGQDWSVEVARVREAVLRRLKAELQVDLEGEIEEEGVMTPGDIAANTGSYRGSLYGIASNSTTAAFLRHPNRSRRYRGLYHVGGSVHPGGGMPLVVLGGKITADLIRRDHPL